MGGGAYLWCLHEHASFRHLLLASTVCNIATWMSYIAVLALVEKAGGGSSLAVSAVTLVRVLPSLLLTPFCGAVADRCNRPHVLVAASLLAGATVTLLPLVAGPAQAWLLYSLLTAQSIALSFYDPARLALLPLAVPRSQLHHATTVDSFAWSLSSSAGASLGGVLVSCAGVAPCLLLDGLVYLAAAWCSYLLPSVCQTEAENCLDLEHSADALGHTELGGLGSPVAGLEGAAGAVAEAAWQPGKPAIELRGDSAWGTPEPHSHRLSKVGQKQHHPGMDGGRRVLFASHPCIPSSSEARPHRLDAPVGGLLRMAAGALHQAAEGVREGWQFCLSPQNRDVLALLAIKCCGGLAWGAVDNINVRFAQLPWAQLSGGPSLMLGLLQAAGGVGCVAGPIAMNALLALRPRPLAWGVAASFGFVMAGYLLMLLAVDTHRLLLGPHSVGVALLFLATAIRSIGSATLWIYSSLLLQLRVPNSVLGRMCAAEASLYTIAKAGASVLCGAAFDLLHLSLQQTIAGLVAAVAAMACVWGAYAVRAPEQWGARGRGGGAKCFEEGRSGEPG